MLEPEPRHRVFYWNGALAVTCCWVTFVCATFAARSLDGLIIYLMLGSLFAQTAVAATWTAVGPGPFIVRWPLAMLWLAILVVIAGLPMALRGNPGMTFLFGLWLGGQYLLSALILGGISLCCGLRLRFQLGLAADVRREGQFGIHQLIGLTAIIAVMLGIARGLWPAEFPDFAPAPWSNIAFMIATEGMLTLPLIVATLLQRRAIVATLACLLFIAIGIPVQVTLFTMVTAIGTNLSSLEFGLTNLICTLVILIFGVTTRQSGYHFGRQRVLPSQVDSLPDGR